MANVKNLASGTLAGSISASTTSLSVYVGAGSSSVIETVWPATPFYATIMPAVPNAGVANSLNSEIVEVTAVSNLNGNTVLTVKRGQRGTSGKAFSDGDIVTAAIYTEDLAGAYSNATATTAGLMSAEDKKKLDGLEVKNEYTESTDDVYSASYVNSAVNAFHSGNYANFNFGAFTVTNQERVLGTHTCTVAGTYLIIMSLSFDLSDGGYVVRKCYKNNVLVAADTPNIIKQANAPRMGGTFATVQTLAVGDVVKMTYQGYISGSAVASHIPNNGWAMIRII